jgi:hypothetical protein
MTPVEEIRPYTYDHIPQLKELLPTTAGVPGVTYLQCCIQNQRKAQDTGWGAISGGSRVYTIQGPKGLADMQLLCKGKPIPGGDIKSGARKCMVDAEVETLTGLWVNGPPEEVTPTPEPEPTKPKADLKAVPDPKEAA